MANVVFFDLETQYSSDDVGGWYPHKMLLSIAVTYSYDDNFKVWTENDIPDIVDYLFSFDYIVGFNIIDFDFKVFGKYMPNDEIEGFEQITIDLLSLIKSRLGHRVPLDEIARSTISKSKNGNGLKAVQLWKEQK